MSYYHYLATGILLLTMAIATLKILAGERKGWPNLASNILIAVLVVEFTVWSVDTVLWLAVQILQYPSALQSLGTRTGNWCCSALIHIPVQHLLSMVGYTAGDLALGIL